MVSFFAYVLVILLHLVPDAATSLTLTSPDGTTWKGLRVEDRSWNLTVDGTTMNFRLAEGTIIGMANGERNDMKVLEVLGLEKEPDWATIQELKVGGQQLEIKRSPNGLEILGAPEGAWKVSWETKKAE